MCCQIQIHKIAVPTPFVVGDVNIYLLQAGENILIDTGPDTEASWVALLAGLSRTGLRPQHIDRVLITHGHEDHYGLSARLADAGARIFIPENDLPQAALEGVKDFYRRELLEAGVPAETVGNILQILGSLSQYGRLPKDYQTIRPGTALGLACGAKLEVIATPGHTPGHVSFFLADSGALFAGDTIISSITPNPILNRDPQHPAKRYQGLRNYLCTLDTLSKLNVRIVYSGHRGELVEVSAYLEKAREFYDARQEKIIGLLKRKPHSVYELGIGLFSNAVRINVFLVVSETLAHLDFMEEQRRIKYDFQHGIRFYRPAAW